MRSLKDQQQIILVKFVPSLIIGCCFILILFVLGILWGYHFGRFYDRSTVVFVALAFQLPWLSCLFLWYDPFLIKYKALLSITQNGFEIFNILYRYEDVCEVHLILGSPVMKQIIIKMNDDKKIILTFSNKTGNNKDHLLEFYRLLESKQS